MLDFFLNNKIVSIFWYKYFVAYHIQKVRY